MENNNTGFRAKIQKFGGVLSGMVMPNIGAFITWGLITAIFLQTGWHPNAHIAKLISPMLSYLLPILIGYTGGKNFYGGRGGVIGAAATMGVIVGADIPMFMGAMIMGPVAALSMKQVDKLFEGKIKPGFEMIVNNFSMGILGIFLALGAIVLIYILDDTIKTPDDVERYLGLTVLTSIPIASGTPAAKKVRGLSARKYTKRNGKK